MNEDPRGDNADSIAVIAVLILIVILAGGGVWLLYQRQQRAMYQAMQAEQEARRMAEVAHERAIAAKREHELERTEALKEAAVEDPALAELRFLAGSWATSKGDALSEALWMSPRNGVMLGLNRSTDDAGNPKFNYLRIEAGEDGIVHYVNSMGRGETAFPLREFSENQAVFENREHDFPRTFMYRLEDDRLHVQTVGLVNDQPHSERQTWRRVR